MIQYIVFVVPQEAQKMTFLTPKLSNDHFLVAARLRAEFSGKEKLFFKFFFFHERLGCLSTFIFKTKIGMVKQNL